MKKRIVTIALVVALLATCFAGTYAYLMDTDSVQNTMVMGGVSIEQHEYQRVFENGEPVLGVAGTDFTADYGINQSYKLEEYVDGKPAMPAVYTKYENPAWDEFQQLWNAVQTDDGFKTPGSNTLFDDSIKNVVDKFVFVENTGKSSVYFRTIVLIEDPVVTTYDAKGELCDYIHTNFNNNNRYSYSSDGSKPGEDAEGFVPAYVTINGIRYSITVATHTEILPKGEIARPSLLQLYLDPTIENDEYAKYGNNWDVLVLSQAVQSDGFEDAFAALNTAFGDVNAANLNTWFAALAPAASAS